MRSLLLLLVSVLTVFAAAQQQAGAPAAAVAAAAAAAVADEGTKAPRAQQQQQQQQHLQLSLAGDKLTHYGASFSNLTVDIVPETEARLHVKIRPSGKKRWEVPDSLVPRPGAVADLDHSRLLYRVAQPVAGAKQPRPFALTVTRLANLEPVFDTRGHTFMFKDQYIELTTAIPKSASLYGLGETTLSTGLLLPRDGRKLTLWNRDKPAADPDQNLYSSHPFYLQVNADGSSHGVLLLNSNGMDVILRETSLTYKIIGGLVDLSFFMGPSPEAVIRQYHQVIGASVMPPYWALGLHQSKWGYANISVLESVVANYSAAGLPLESLWVDIEYMASRFKTMTFDPVRYPAAKMRQFVSKLHAAGQSWVPIVDPAVSVDATFRAYVDGTRDKIWMRDHKGKTYMGQVWPGMAVYPDYLHPNMSSWLTKQLSAFHAEVPFDGLWLDMSEPSNFCTGLNCRLDPKNDTAKFWLQVHTTHDYKIAEMRLITNRTTCQMACEAAPPSNTLAHPPYVIANVNVTGTPEPLGQNILSPTAKHYDNTTEYDAHNLYGFAMAQQHYSAAVNVTGRRPFLLTRATFPGAGRFTGHWTGDNAGNWENLWFSIAGVLNTNMWGMAMAGADICGFADMTQDNVAEPPDRFLSDHDYEQLCNRWTSAGAFYPFSRNHMIIYGRAHEFYRWPSVTATAKKAYGLRYRLLSYMYSSLALVAAKGGTLARPLLFSDPSDLRARNATAQWMLGEGLLVSPVITPNTTTIRPYFTAGNWYSAWDFKRLRVPTGRPVQLAASVGDIPVHIRGGAILPMQVTPSLPNVTRDVRWQPVTLVVALPAEPSPKRAARAQVNAGPLPPHILDAPCAEAHLKNPGRLVSCGFLYADNDTVTTSINNTLQVWFTAVTAQGGRSGSISSFVLANAPPAKGQLSIEAIHILGVPGTAADVPAVSVYAKGQKALSSYDAGSGVLRIRGLKLDAGVQLNVDWRLRKA
ncbi:hypothetical protein OEZ85_000147 [Tetradesmus obliquus]|uniref:Maltase n=1 Tax=Tetradesmus obliquus TaxID=3088 RepID=A0ABY8USS8_TETOB|nr:hypothetical protein OEZ85_000147 [Tetradesmus obliquus]